MKSKILSLVVVLSMLLSLGIAIPASAATVADTSAPAAAPADVICEDCEDCDDIGDEPIGTYDEAYVSMYGLDNNNGTAGSPWRTITHAVNQLPYDRVGGDLSDPPGTTLAKNDRINVLPSGPDNFYGYNGNALSTETIVIGPNAVIEAVPGALVVLRSFGWLGSGANAGQADPANPADCTNTIINIGAQGNTPWQVIEITDNWVIVKGFTITGSQTGVWAHGICDDCETTDVNEYSPIHDVRILDNCIKVDQYEYGIGIEMQCVKYACIHNNQIWVGTMGANLPLSVQCASGILMDTCFEACITSNTLNIWGDFMATGMHLLDCPRTTVDDNIVNVKAYIDATAIGILAGSSKCAQNPCAIFDGSDLIKITRNQVNVEAKGVDSCFAFGIIVKDSDRVVVHDNDPVNVLASSTSDGKCDLFLAEGILLKNCNESCITENNVMVTGKGIFNSNGLQSPWPLEVDEESLKSEIEDFLDDIESAVGGENITYSAGAGLVVGIKVINCCDRNDLECFDCPDVCGYNDVVDNVVTVKLAADFIAGNDEDASLAGGLGAAFGIFGYGSPYLLVDHNIVNVDKATAEWRGSLGLPQVMVNVKVQAVEVLPLDYYPPISIGLALNLALGITLFNCDNSHVTFNSVYAAGSANVDIDAVPTVDDLDYDAAMSVINTEILSSIYQAIRDTASSEDINVDIDSPLPTIETFGAGGVLSVGIAIKVWGCDNVVIAQNPQADGIGDVAGTVRCLASLHEEGAEAWGAGLGLGGSIWVFCSKDAKVKNNVCSATGLGDIEISAKHSNVPLPPIYGLFAEAYGGAGGVAIGILIVGPNAGCTEVKDNTVQALGKADKVCLKAVDEVPDDEARAIGVGLGLALGIASLWADGIIISGNDICAQAYADTCVITEAITRFDPSSTGGSIAIGIGILAVKSDYAQIIGNTAIGTGQAKGFVFAIDKWLTTIQSAKAFGGSLGYGGGIIVIGCYKALVKGNPVATGVGDACTIAFAINAQPLEDACAFAMSVGIGKGIGVICSPKTDVIECNTAAGKGTARVLDFACADFNYWAALGFSASIDIFVFLPFQAPAEFAEVDAEGNYCKGKVNYNSMVDPVPGDCVPNTWNGWCVIKIDAGLLNIGPDLDAKFNWWNHATGPSGRGPGNGEAVLWCTGEVWFSPWLYVPHGVAIDDQTGYFGFYIDLCKGLNAVSTPIALESVIVQSGTWGDVLVNSGLLYQKPDLTWVAKYKYLQKFDSASQQWVFINDPFAEDIDPLVGYYIYLYDSPKPLYLVLMVNASEDSWPMRTLLAGWNLIGPNPIFPDRSIPADDALVSVEQQPDGDPGYVQVVSPVVRCQPSWYYVRGGKNAPDMKSGHAYWVYMLNEAVLAGFGFTPLPHQLDGYYYFW